MTPLNHVPHFPSLGSPAKNPHTLSQELKLHPRQLASQLYLKPQSVILQLCHYATCYLVPIDHCNQPASQPVWHTHTYSDSTELMFDQSLSHARPTGNPFIWQLEQITTHITHADGAWVRTAGGHILTRNKPSAAAHTEDTASRATRGLALFYWLDVLSHHTGPWCERMWRIVGAVIDLINVQWWHSS